MSEHKVISEEALRSGLDAVLGVDPTQAPTDPDELNERLTSPQKGVTQALTMVLGQAQVKHVKRAVPLVYALLEAGERAYPAELCEEIPMKSFAASIAAVSLEAMETVKLGAAPPPEVATTRTRQPVLVKFIDDQILSEHSFAQKLTRDERSGVYALLLATVRTLDRVLTGAEKPVIAVKSPGRNDPCHCGSGKKFKKCHGGAAA